VWVGHFPISGGKDVIDLLHRQVNTAAGPSELPSMYMDFLDFQLVNCAAEAAHQSSVNTAVVLVARPVY
jgi:hypothetical protein